MNGTEKHEFIFWMEQFLIRIYLSHNPKFLDISSLTNRIYIQSSTCFDVITNSISIFHDIWMIKTDSVPSL